MIPFIFGFYAGCLIGNCIIGLLTKFKYGVPFWNALILVPFAYGRRQYSKVTANGNTWCLW